MSFCWSERFCMFSAMMHTHPTKDVGDPVNELTGIKVFYNGGVKNVEESNVTEDGYNVGLKYQCVEFVKRYYLQKLNHKVPESYGHAKDFFDPSVENGSLNTKRNLIQYRNG